MKLMPWKRSTREGPNIELLSEAIAWCQAYPECRIDDYIALVKLGYEVNPVDTSQCYLRGYGVADIRDLARRELRISVEDSWILFDSRNTVPTLLRLLKKLDRKGYLVGRPERNAH